MKRVERSVMRLNEAIDMLISYQAYCLCTGCEHVSFAEALRNSYEFSVMSTYYDMLHNKVKDIEEETCEGFLRRVLGLVSYSSTKDALAESFILLNAYLRKSHNELCILSWYDMQTLIEVFGQRKEYVTKLLFGTLRCGDDNKMYHNTIRNIINNSIHSEKTFEAWADTDCPLRVLSLWLLSPECSIDNGGVQARVLSNIESERYMRGNVVFTKVLNRTSFSEYNSCAKKYKYDCIDKVSALLYSLPIVSCVVYEIEPGDTVSHITTFIRDVGNSNSFMSSDIVIAQDDNKRAVMCDDFVILSRYCESYNNYVITIAQLKGRAFVVRIDKTKIMSKYGLPMLDRNSVEAVGNTLDFTIRNDKERTIHSLMCGLINTRLTS